MESVSTRFSAVCIHTLLTLYCLIKYQQSQLSTPPLPSFSRIVSFITETNRAGRAYFSARAARFRTTPGVKQICTRACTLRFLARLLARKDSVSSLANASVNSGSRHACVTNSPRRLLLSEVTEHKVMTAVVLPNSIQQLCAALFPPQLSLSIYLHIYLSLPRLSYIPSHTFSALPCHRFRTIPPAAAAATRNCCDVSRFLPLFRPRCFHQQRFPFLTRLANIVGQWLSEI